MLFAFFDSVTTGKVGTSCMGTYITGNPRLMAMRADNFFPFPYTLSVRLPVKGF